MHWWWFYGFVTASSVLTIYRDKRRSGDALGAVLLLAGLWVISNLSHMSLPQPNNTFFPVLDAVSASCLVWAWRFRQASWKLALIALFGADMWTHVGYFSSFDPSEHTKHVYDLTLNVLYLGQLLAVVSPTLLRRITAV